MNDLEWLFHVKLSFCPAVLLGAFDIQSPPQKMNEDRCTQLVMKMLVNECSF